VVHCWESEGLGFEPWPAGTSGLPLTWVAKTITINSQPKSVPLMKKIVCVQ